MGFLLLNVIRYVSTGSPENQRVGCIQHMEAGGVKGIALFRLEKKALHFIAGLEGGFLHCRGNLK
jgi:hypothetical protein